MNNISLLKETNKIKYKESHSEFKHRMKQLLSAVTNSLEMNQECMKELSNDTEKFDEYKLIQSKLTELRELIISTLNSVRVKMNIPFGNKKISDEIFNKYVKIIELLYS